MPPLPLLQRSYFGVVLVLVAIASYFQAQGITMLLGSLLLHEPPPPRPARVASSAPAPKSADALRAHNVFDSSMPAPARSLPRRDFSDPLSWPPCEGVQAVIITESPDPHWSVASLRATRESRAQLRRAGDSAAGKRVAFVGFNPRQQAPAVWLEDADAPCQALLFREPPPAPLPVATPNDGEVKVERSVVENALVDPARLLRSVRVVPEVKDGKTVGLRLFGIRPETLLGNLGVRNGDRLESINGFEVANPEKALEAYARLRTAAQLRLRLVRAGAPVELTVNVI